VLMLRVSLLVVAAAAVAFAVPSGSVSGSVGTRWQIRDLGVGLAPSVVNDLGQVAGAQAVKVSGYTQNHAFLLRGGRMIDLTPGLPLMLVDTEKSICAGRVSVAYQESFAVAFNGRGQVLVAAKNFCGEVTPPGAWLWQNGNLTPLPTLGGTYTSAASISESGQVVGSSATRSGENHAFLWRKGKAVDLGALGGGSSWATAINERGQVAGASLTSHKADTYGNRIAHAFIWKNGRMTDLGSLGKSSSYPSDLNESGQVVGTTSGQHAFVWQRGKLTDLGEVSSHAVDEMLTDTDPVAINNRGQVMLSRKTADGHKHAFVWQHGRFTDLGRLPGRPDSQVVAINERGQVIGNAGNRAFVWENGTLYDLGTLPSTQPYRSSRAVAINDKGQIVGVSTSAGGATHAVVWTPVSG
jgi:probable HAF family extracellular repeat protein